MLLSLRRILLTALIHRLSRRMPLKLAMLSVLSAIFVVVYSVQVPNPRNMLLPVTVLSLLPISVVGQTYQVSAFFIVLLRTCFGV